MPADAPQAEEAEQQADQGQDEVEHVQRLLSSFDICGGAEATNNGCQQAGQSAGAAGGAVEAAHGWDVLVRVVQARGLAASDWWNGLSDPYVKLRIAAAAAAAAGAAAGKEEGEAVQYRTRTIFRDLDPVYDEFFEVGNMPAGSELEAEVWDKDLVTPDDELGHASWVFAPSASQGRCSIQLPLVHPQRRRANAGELELEVFFKPSEEPGTLRLLGPVRFRQQLSPLSGFLMGHWKDDRMLAFSTYKIFLCHTPDVFGSTTFPWNRRHPAACHIYKSPVMLSAVRSQHAALYATQLGRCRAGVLRSAPDLFALLGCGVRGGQRRYFTYSLLPDSLRCSETGATFCADMMSKHAMHAGGAEEVVYAGEFCIVPEEGAPGGHRLVVDNNSGTFAPDSEHLPLMAQLFQANFPGIRVETVAVGDPRLDEYHRQCPSRLKAAAAAAAVAEAEAAADAAAGGSGSGRSHSGKSGSGKSGSGRSGSGGRARQQAGGASP